MSKRRTQPPIGLRDGCRDGAVAEAGSNRLTELGAADSRCRTLPAGWGRALGRGSDDPVEQAELVRFIDTLTADEASELVRWFDGVQLPRRVRWMSWRWFRQARLRQGIVRKWRIFDRDRKRIASDGRGGDAVS